MLLAQRQKFRELVGVEKRDLVHLWRPAIQRQLCRVWRLSNIDPDHLNYLANPVFCARPGLQTATLFTHAAKSPSHCHICESGYAMEQAID
mgnify:CR=1 FL=1